MKCPSVQDADVDTVVDVSNVWRVNDEEETLRKIAAHCRELRRGGDHGSFSNKYPSVNAMIIY